MKNFHALTVLVFATVLSAPAQNSDAAMQALVAEVRQLRLAVERATAAAPRIQITLQRLQWQEQKVAALTLQHTAAREHSARLAGSQARMADDLRNIEARAASEQDQVLKKTLDQERRAVTAALEEHRQQAQQAQLRESELAGVLRTESARVK